MHVHVCVTERFYNYAQIVVNEDGIHSLIIYKTAKWDSGTYTCIARNHAGEDKFTVGLNVHREFPSR